MIVSTLYNLKTEIERLYVTGIRGSRNNPHILQCISVVEKYADEEPAYASLTSALKHIVKRNSSIDVKFFAEIYASLNYLIRLHQEPVASDEERSEHTPVFEIENIETTHSFSDLRSLIAALTEPEEENLESIRMGRKNRLFDDFRTYPYLNIALDNELISAEVQDIIKNEIGERMIPFMLKGFHHNTEQGNLRRLSLLRDFQYEHINRL